MFLLFLLVTNTVRQQYQKLFQLTMSETIDICFNTERFEATGTWDNQSLTDVSKNLKKPHVTQIRKY